METADRRRSYTLIEVLVVIGIIAALAGLIFGVLGPAREKARQAVCVSNMHQVGKAYAMYRADWDGVDPVKGVRMTYDRIGLPPYPYRFFRDYGLWTPGGVLVCPSHHRILRDPANAWSWRHSTYCLSATGLDMEDDRGAYVIALRGPDLVLLGCDQHNDFVEFEYEPQPEWATKLVFVLRISQQVSRRRVPAALPACREW